MASDERRNEDKKIIEENFHKSLSAKEKMAETDAFQCARCKQRQCVYRQQQTRSADEPMTVCSSSINAFIILNIYFCRLLLRECLFVILSSMMLNSLFSDVRSVQTGGNFVESLLFCLFHFLFASLSMAIISMLYVHVIWDFS